MIMENEEEQPESIPGNCPDCGHAWTDHTVGGCKICSCKKEP